MNGRAGGWVDVRVWGEEMEEGEAGWRSLGDGWVVWGG